MLSQQSRALGWSRTNTSSDTLRTVRSPTRWRWMTLVPKRTLRRLRMMESSNKAAGWRETRRWIAVSFKLGTIPRRKNGSCFVLVAVSRAAASGRRARAGLAGEAGARGALAAAGLESRHPRAHARGKAAAPMGAADRGGE